jgi:NAD(P)-dependent dehydrogenase (short-subunit alcohol dehydrogenase family)
MKEGGDATPFAADLSEEQNASSCVRLAVNTYGKLDILINNAGVFPVMEEIQNFPIEAFDYLIKNNIRTTFLMTRYAIPELQKTRGCIVAAGSESGKIGLAKNTPYGGTKGWIHSFIRGVAVEQAQYGVRANCVCPGAIDTAWTHKETGPMTAKDEKMLLGATPLGRRGTPEEIANAYLFLASDEASYVTGALFSVDGGITIAKGPVGEQAESAVKKEPKGELHLEHSLDGATNMLRGNREVHKP